MMSDIDWEQKRSVFQDTDTEEYFVMVPGGYMEIDDYKEGGAIILSSDMGPLKKIGVFTNAEIDNDRHTTPKGN